MCGLNEKRRSGQPRQTAVSDAVCLITAVKGVSFYGNGTDKGQSYDCKKYAETHQDRL